MMEADLGFCWSWRKWSTAERGWLADGGVACTGKPRCHSTFTRVAGT